MGTAIFPEKSVSHYQSRMASQESKDINYTAAEA
jgi:hypothetical protein